MIIGFGRVGRLVAEMLAVHDKPYVAVDSNIDAVKAARARGLSARSSATPRGPNSSTGSTSAMPAR